MNFYAVVYYLGWVVEVLGFSLLMPSFVGLFYHESVWFIYLIAAVCCLAIGTLFIIKKPKYSFFYAKEGFVTVALAWLIMSLIGAIPFHVSGEIPSFLDAFFESASGFSTTGASILTDIPALSHAALFWRSFTHWIGGMGVLVFLLAILPASGGGSMQLMKAESPGPSIGKFVPKIRETAMILYVLYTVMTILETIFLLFGGMPWFDAITTAFATAGTGGFSIRSSSIAFYNSAYIEIVITVFMLLFGVNFSIYYLILTKRIREVRDNEEIRAYGLIVLVSIAVVVLNISRMPVYDHNIPLAVKDSAFSVATLVSSTGFGTVDYNQWPQLSKAIFFVLMFIGSSAGSTGGGLKVQRILILLKSSLSEIGQLVHPRSVRSATIDKRKIDNRVIRQTKSYFVIFMLIYITSVLIVSLDDFDMTTSLTSVIATLNNIGPGLGLVGPKGGYAEFSALSKIVFIFDMIAGRLELLPMLVLFSPTVIKDTSAALARRSPLKRKKLKRID